MPGILLQFIDGAKLDEINPSSSIIISHPHIAQSAVSCAEKIASLGVLHGDIGVANFMVRHEDIQVFILDFAAALIRENESEDEWADCINSEREDIELKLLLDERQLRDRTRSLKLQARIGGTSITSQASVTWSPKLEFMWTVRKNCSII